MFHNYTHLKYFCFKDRGHISAFFMKYYDTIEMLHYHMMILTERHSVCPHSKPNNAGKGRNMAAFWCQNTWP